ncbi:MAG: SDR family oxidoreductase [Alphaproteobacteria bacterium]|nr:SDR family oxidoreductase [Alphaproteobacteria bacterium]
MNQFATYPSLKNEAVIVTGGASGIGASIVEHFAEQGARVGFVDLDEAAGRALATKTGAAFIACDLRNIVALRIAIARFERDNGPTLALVNNAARDDRHTIEEVTPEYWDDRMATNLRHQFFAAQAVLPAMRKRKRGSLINMGSISWMLALGGMPAYVTSKSAIQGLTRGLARDVGSDGIRANCLVPGWIMTERQVKLWLTPESEGDLMAKQCLKEKLFPPDVARMTLWLAADDSRMVTAQSFVVDGGWA